MWGYGAPDSLTIPSQFVSLSGHYVATNFGQIAYTAHQSLETLIQQVQRGERSDLVVFYDGVNEVLHKCRSEHGWFSHGREAVIREILNRPSPLTWRHMVEPFHAFAKMAKASIRGIFSENSDIRAGELYDCDVNPEKAERVAEALYQDWRIAKLIVESWGGKFYGFLQPVSFLSKTKKEHLPSDPLLERQYAAVYPLKRMKIEREGNFVDISDILDRPETIYFDAVHVSPVGNELVARRIIRHITGEDPATSRSTAQRPQPLLR